MGQVEPVQKVSVLFIFILENCRIQLNLVKFLEYYLFIRKMHMTYQNAQKNVTYLFGSESCIVKQL
jgi:hypothetical protein